MAKQDVDQAVRCYSEAVALRPNDPNFHHNLGIALQHKGESERAIRELETARQLEANGKRD
jgi:Flp pilus assembly protein TadD